MAKVRIQRKDAGQETPTWFRRGIEGRKAADRDEELRGEEQSRRVFRYHLKPGESGKVIFIDGAPDDPFLMDEHSMYPSKRGPYTCPGDHSECPLCEMNQSKRRICALTALDLRPFTSERTGKSFKITKKLMAFPNRARKKFFARVEKIPALKGDVKFTLWEFSRDTEDECGTGETYEFQQKRFSKEKLIEIIKKRLPAGTNEAVAKETIKELLTPFDYMKIFEPLPVEQLRQISGGSTVVGAGEDEEYKDEEFDVEEQEDLAPKTKKKKISAKKPKAEEEDEEESEDFDADEEIEDIIEDEDD